MVLSIHPTRRGRGDEEERGGEGEGRREKGMRGRGGGEEGEKGGEGRNGEMEWKDSEVGEHTYCYPNLLYK